ncbi:MAG: nuclease-related domain-containing protein [Actinomycetota bacterium]
MNHWVAAFVGEGARRNYERTLLSGEFWVSSHRTPIRRLRAGDRLLMFLCGEGFTGEAVAAAPCRAPYGEEPDWLGRRAVAGISLASIRLFDVPVRYGFPQGYSDALGLHRRALTSGFAAVSAEGFRDVISRAAQTMPAQTTPADAEPRRDDGREKRSVGQPAVAVGRRRGALWTAVEAGATALGAPPAERLARDKAREAGRTWVTGGRVEREVGAALDGLAECGYYLFHDLALPGGGNVDHVALGPQGFFAVETKSHAGRVAARGGMLLLNGRQSKGDFIAQAWRGCYRLREIVGSEVSPLLCFTRASVEEHLFVRGVRVVPLRLLAGYIFGRPVRNDSRRITAAVGLLEAATNRYPSTVPRARSRL